MASRFITPVFQALDSKGKALPGAKLFFFEVGSSTTLKDTFTDITQSTSNSNPVLADGAGIFPNIFGSGLYRVALQDRKGRQEWERDNVQWTDVANASFNFNTVADMISGTLPSGSSVSLLVGETANTLGYTTVDDGGAAKYFVSASTGSDDGGLRIDLDNGLQSQLITNNELNIRQFGAFGDYASDDSLALVNVLLAYVETNLPVYAPRGIYNIAESIDLPDRLVMRGDGAPIMATFPQVGGDKSLLRAGFKDQMSGTSFIFTGVDKSYATTRSDRYATQTYAVSCQEPGPIQLKDFAIIQDMDVLDAGGAVTTTANDNLVPIGAGLVLSNTTISNFNGLTVFGYFGNAGLIIHNPLTINDPEYNTFLDCIITGGTAIIGNDTAAGAAPSGITGMRFVDCGIYAADHQTRADGDYTIPAIYIDGFIGGAQAGIRGHSWTGCNVRTYANDAISLDHTDDITFTDCATEFPLLIGVANADALGGFAGTANTKNFRAHALAATNDLKMGSFIASISGNFQITGAGIFDNAVFGQGGSGVRLFGSGSSGNSVIQLTDDFSSTVNGWSIIKDKTASDFLDLRFENVSAMSFDPDGGIGGKFGLGFGGTKTLVAGVISLTFNSYFAIDTEAAAATDDLDTIDGGLYEGQMITIRPATSTRTVVVKDLTGNIRCGTDFTMDNVFDRMQLMYDGTVWVAITRSNNGA